MSREKKDIENVESELDENLEKSIEEDELEQDIIYGDYDGDDYDYEDEDDEEDEDQELEEELAEIQLSPEESKKLKEITGRKKRKFRNSILMRTTFVSIFIVSIATILGSVFFLFTPAPGGTYAIEGANENAYVYYIFDNDSNVSFKNGSVEYKGEYSWSSQGSIYINIPEFYMNDQYFYELTGNNIFGKSFKIYDDMGNTLVLIEAELAQCPIYAYDEFSLEASKDVIGIWNYVTPELQTMTYRFNQDGTMSMETETIKVEANYYVDDNTIYTNYYVDGQNIEEEIPYEMINGVLFLNELEYEKAQ